MSRSKTPRPRRASEVADTRARTAAALILEVLAGLRTPGEAAETLGMSLPRYYHLEERAIAGLTAACAPAPPGPSPEERERLQQMRREHAALRQEVCRLTSLLRTAQKAIGLKAAQAPEQKRKAARQAGKRAPRKAAVRAGKAAARLRASLPADAAPPPAAADAASGGGSDTDPDQVDPEAAPASATPTTADGDSLLPATTAEP